MNTQHRTIGVAVSSVAIGALLILVPALPTDAHSEPNPATVYCEARGFKPECRVPGPQRPSRPKQLEPAGQPDDYQTPETRCGVPAPDNAVPSNGTTTTRPTNRHLEELENMDAKDTLKPSASVAGTPKPRSIDDFVVKPSPW